MYLENISKKKLVWGKSDALFSFDFTAIWLLILAYFKLHF